MLNCFHCNEGALLSNAKKLLMVEQNSESQMAGLIREKTGIHIEDKLLKYDGRPFCPEEIYQKAIEVMK